jgi:hypothetical protein
MKFSLSTPDWTKVFKDNYRKYSATVTLRTKRRKNTTETIDTGIETQVKDRSAVNREITVSAATKVITLNETMETPTVVKVEATVVTQ